MKSPRELNKLPQGLAHPRRLINSSIATCHHYRFASKLRLMEGMRPAQGHRLGKGLEIRTCLQVHRSPTSYPVERAHPGLPYPDPRPAGKSFTESGHNLKTSQGFADSLPGDRPRRAAQTPTVQPSKGSAGGQKMAEGPGRGLPRHIQHRFAIKTVGLYQYSFSLFSPRFSLGLTSHGLLFIHLLSVPTMCQAPYWECNSEQKQVPDLLELTVPSGRHREEK